MLQDLHFFFDKSLCHVELVARGLQGSMNVHRGALLLVPQ